MDKKHKGLPQREKGYTVTEMAALLESNVDQFYAMRMDIKALAKDRRDCRSLAYLWGTVVLVSNVAWLIALLIGKGVL